MNLKVKKLDSSAILPTRKYKFDAGLDLYVIEDYQVDPYKWMEVKYGIAVEIPKNYYGLITLRSGLGKRGILGHPGIIDTQYRGYLSQFIINLSDSVLEIKKGDRVGQLLIIPCILPTPIKVKNLNESERNEQGLGSSGK